MRSKTIWDWNWLDPISLLEHIHTFITALVSDILRLFGPFPESAFENTQAVNIEDAAAHAVEKEASVDA